ncbi:YrhK family protein [Pseudoalteromonas sp. Isolate3]|uniref:YrhK family protein n=1 Tax=Pseudoalteromonas sp. Isolate3 TaxID=2908526 RepID=UPI001EFDCCAD|nr:YrhK family protein [Pseudoalteromonas sp. Isolate3]MCG9710644.1 YrhK family protein [Pseudoalteromonas sp. Isolate3]
MKFTLAPRVNALVNILSACAFFFGSTLFLPAFIEYTTLGVVLFMIGSSLFLLSAFADYYSN